MEKRTPSLQNVLLTVFLLMIGVLLFFVSFNLVGRMHQMLEKNAIERTRDTVRQSASTLEVYVNSALNTLHFAASPIASTSESVDALRLERMIFLTASRSDLVSLAFFAEDGSLRYSTSQGLRMKPKEIASTQWFQRAWTGQGATTAFTGPHVQHLFANQHSLVISLARGLEYRENGIRKIGIMLMDLEYTAIQSVIDSVTLGDSGYVYLMDETGTILAHHRMDMLNHQLDHEDTAAVLTQVVGTTRDTVDSRERVLEIMTVGQSRWRLVGVAYIDELLALQTSFLRILTVVVLTGGLLSLAVATLMAYYVTQPLRSLEKKMKSIQEGALDVTIAERGFREIRSLSSAFNHMVGQIRSLMQSVVREQEVKRMHELNALQAQINPHFLYNTLDSIVWMEERGKSKEAITMVMALSRLFRISISRGRSFISVKEELEHVRNYLIIQKMRFKERFTYEIESQPEVLAERTVKLIIQPLVENCINHAIDEAQQEPLHISITAALSDDEIHITVSDDGMGIPQEKLPLLLTTQGGTGIGLKNVHERLQLTYGKSYGLTVTSEEWVGTSILIRIPRGR